MTLYEPKKMHVGNANCDVCGRKLKPDTEQQFFPAFKGLKARSVRTAGNEADDKKNISYVPVGPTCVNKVQRFVIEEYATKEATP